MTGTMPRRGTCNVEGCTDPRVKGAFVCTAHLGEKRRCEGRVREIDPDSGETLAERQCKKSARPGHTLCHAHGASGPKSAAVAQRTEALTTMQRLVQPYEGDLDPITAFEKEFRRTYGRILWLEEQIAGLEDEQALIFGLTREEHINAGEFPGTNKTYEARIHVFEEMLRWERKHFLDLEKTWIKANLEDKRLSIMQSQIDYTYSLVMKAAAALGHNPSDPETRTTIGRLFEGEIRALPAPVD